MCCDTYLDRGNDMTLENLNTAENCHTGSVAEEKALFLQSTILHISEICFNRFPEIYYKRHTNCINV